MTPPPHSGAEESTDLKNLLRSATVAIGTRRNPFRKDAKKREQHYLRTLAKNC